MTIWEPLWEAAKTILFNSLGVVASMNEVGSALAAFLQPLIDAFSALLYLTAYPFICLISIVQYAIMGLINPVIEFFNGIIFLVNDIGYLLNIFIGIFPAIWTTILVMLLLANLSLRVYFFAKDIHILGNSI